MSGATLLKLATSRVGIVAILCLALFTWHKLDKGSAVRDAVVRYVADVELSAAEAEAERLREQAADLRAANAALEAAITKSEKESRDAEEAIRQYIRETPEPTVCRAGDSLIDLLRSN